MNTNYGFQATMTAKPGKADELVELLLDGPITGPSSHEGCTVFLVSRSSAHPDIIHLIEGWTSEAVHAEVFASPEAQAYIARFGDLVSDSQYTDHVLVGGKAVLAASSSALGSSSAGQ